MKNGVFTFHSTPKCVFLYLVKGLSSEPNVIAIFLKSPLLLSVTVIALLLLLLREIAVTVA